VPATAVTDKLALTVERAENGFTIKANETGSNDVYISDSVDLSTTLSGIVTEWAERTPPVQA